MSQRTGQYDEGYSSCPCFWGRAPGSLVLELEREIVSFAGMLVLDIGCGEGKNAAYMAERGAKVLAVDFSKLAIRNARGAWPHLRSISWAVADAEATHLPTERFDIVVAYGLLHCLESGAGIERLVAKLQRATRRGGHNVICAMNDRAQDLTGHKELVPSLISHEAYSDMYKHWRVLSLSDADLIESHPHNNLRHRHSMTRLIARNE